MDIFKTTRENFFNAIKFARMYCQKNRRKNIVAYRCELFLDENKGTIKKCEKKQAEITNKLKLELDMQKANLGFERDGRLVLDAQGEPAMTKENTKEYTRLIHQFQDDISKAVDDFMDEEIEIKHSPFNTLIPADMDFDTQKALQGFVLILKNDFPEITEQDLK